MLKTKDTTHIVCYILIFKKWHLEKSTQPISPFWVALATMATSVLLARSGRDVSRGPDAKQQSPACLHPTGWLRIAAEDQDHPLFFTRQRWNRAGTQRPLGCGAVRWPSDRRASRSNLREAWQEREKSMGTGNMNHDMGQTGSQGKTYNYF